MSKVERTKAAVMAVLGRTEYDANVKAHLPIAMSDAVLLRQVEQEVPGMQRRFLVFALGELRREGIVTTRVHRSGITLYKLADKVHAQWGNGVVQVQSTALA